MRNGLMTWLPRIWILHASTFQENCSRRSGGILLTSSKIWNHSSIYIFSVADRIMVPKDVHVPIPRNCEYITLFYKMDFLDMVTSSWIIWYNHQGPYKQETRVKVGKEMRWWSSGWSCGFEDGGSSHKPWAADSLSSWRRQGEDPPLEPPEGNVALTAPRLLPSKTDFTFLASRTVTY